MNEEVKAIIAHSQSYPFDIDVTTLLKKWRKKKSHFIKAFGGNTIARSPSPIKITLSKEQRDRKFDDFIYSLDENNVLTEELEQFLKNNKEGFFNNQVTQPYPSKNITRGTKLSKSFSKFIEGEARIRRAQNIASRYIQENKIEGYLYLSVDPRDFLTMSENNNHWTTCHALDGDYRAGNLNCMVDKTTLIIYLADEKQEKLKCMPEGITWNSKKWRMLIHINQNCIYYDKQYPFFCKELVDASHKMILEYFKGYSVPLSLGFRTVQNQSGNLIPVSSNYISYYTNIINLNKVINMSKYLGYRDLIHSFSYAPLISIHDKFIYNSTLKEVFSIKIGSKAPCVCCGKRPIRHEWSFLCPKCTKTYNASKDFFLSCDNCGHRIYDEDEVFWEDDEAYCKTCHNIKLREDMEED